MLNSAAASTQGGAQPVEREARVLVVVGHSASKSLKVAVFAPNVAERGRTTYAESHKMTQILGLCMANHSGLVGLGGTPCPEGFMKAELRVDSFWQQFVTIWIQALA